MLRSIRRSLAVDSCHAFARVMVILRLDYCNGLLGSAPKGLFGQQLLSGVIKAAARLILVLFWNPLPFDAFIISHPLKLGSVTGHSLFLSFWSAKVINSCIDEFVFNYSDYEDWCIQTLMYSLKSLKQTQINRRTRNSSFLGRNSIWDLLLNRTQCSKCVPKEVGSRVKSAQIYLAGVCGSGGSDDGHMEKWGSHGFRWRSGDLTPSMPPANRALVGLKLSVDKKPAMAEFGIDFVPNKKPKMQKLSQGSQGSNKT